MDARTEWRLYLGKKPTGIVVRPDEKYGAMYRVHWGDLPPSDMVNLTRAKDAARRWAGRAGGNTGKQLRWKPYLNTHFSSKADRKAVGAVE
jgi:hypothetical protein